jgi:DNA-binding NarL/FixJ family response regulator
MLAAEVDLVRACTLCSRFRPDVLMLARGFGRDAMLRHATEQLRVGRIRCLAYLDDDMAVGRACDVLRLGRSLYFTRHQSIRQICGRLVEAVRNSQAIAPDIVQLEKHDNFGVLKLTRRERQVLMAIANGSTVSDVATSLGIAPSTADNHKSRLMSKLRIHKSVHLLRVALATGLVE